VGLMARVSLVVGWRGQHGYYRTRLLRKAVRA
jgi:hypothetical protein